ncbi:MAG: DUF971 domain-containing protein [Gammaproteobacteria bacterium]|nr:MAG: DUF971 domain-containing protein [Gammaproteobacteria bacterium]
MRPVQILWHKKSRCLELVYENGRRFKLSAEYLRVYSPSAEVTGHGGQGGQLVSGKRFVSIQRIEPVGDYALRFVFDDGHDSGLYTWRYLYELAMRQPQKWTEYLEKLRQAGAKREPDDVTILRLD